MPNEEGHNTTEKVGKMRENPTACDGGDHVSSDHDNTRYLEIYRHRWGILLKLRQQTLECHREDDAALTSAIGA